MPDVVFISPRKYKIPIYVMFCALRTSGFFRCTINSLVYREESYETGKIRNYHKYGADT